jgi:hypothetical protein
METIDVVLLGITLTRSALYRREDPIMITGNTTLGETTVTEVPGTP